jgi:metallo-beta-lactamase class B
MPMSSFPSNFPSNNMSRRTLLTSVGISAASALIGPPAFAFDQSPDWTTPLNPFRIASNLYYVGSRDLAAFLIPTSAGHILINSNLATSPPQIRASIEKLGYHYQDVKILLISHAHYDHCAGSAQLRQESGAKYMVMDADIPVVESGGKKDFHFGTDPTMFFPATKVDRPLQDGEQVALGDTVLTAHKTAGHTKGCTTWTLKVTENGKTLNAVIVGSPYALSGYNLIDDKQYPQIAADFTRQFQTLKSLPCDIFLGAHGGYFGLLAKFDRQKAGDANAFVDPAGYKSFIADSQQGFETELARQQKAHSS